MTAVDDRSTAEADGGDPPRPKVARYVALAVGVVLALFIALLATRPSGTDDRTENPLVGKRVPLLGGATLDGGRVSADTFRGKWVVVNFVAEWCVACKVEHPDLVAFQQAHPEDVQVVGVAYDSKGNEELRTFFEENGGNPWPVITSDDGRAAIEFGVTAVPETFVVAPSQIVIAHAEGVTLEWLEDVLRQGKALQASADSAPTSTVSTPTPTPTSAVGR